MKIVSSFIYSLYIELDLRATIDREIEEFVEEDEFEDRVAHLCASGNKIPLTVSKVIVESAISISGVDLGVSASGKELNKSLNESLRL